MLEVLVALAVGAVIGRVGRRISWLDKAAGQLTNWGVLLLLFCMGLGLGGNPEVMRDLPLLGGQALLLAIASGAGALLCCLPIALAGRGKEK